MPELIRRRRTAALVAAWLAGTVLVVTLGIQAVAVVSESVTEARPAPLSAAAVRRALAEESGQAPSSGPPGTGTTDAPTGTTPATGGPAATVTTRPATGGTQPGGSGTTTTRPAATTGPTATATTTATTAQPPSGAAEDRTYDLIGGSVGVRFENGAARLLWATPAAGFRAERRGDSGEVDVRFRSDTHESRFRAFWDNGPQAEVEERPD